MRFIKSPEELRRLPIGVALLHAVIYGLAVLYFVLAVLAVGFGGWLTLRQFIDPEHPTPGDKRLLVGVGTVSILFYGYVAMFHLSALADADPDAIMPAWMRLCVLFLFIGSVPILLVCVPVVASLFGIAAAIYWLFKRAGRDPDRWLDRIRRRIRPENRKPTRREDKTS